METNGTKRDLENLTPASLPEIQEGQIWRERDPRFVRYVKVMMILRPKGVRVKTCTERGEHLKGARETEVNRDRFAKAFTLIRSPTTHARR